MSDRRRVLKAITFGLGGAIVAAIALPVLRVLGHPVGKKIVRGADVPVPVGSSGQVVKGGPPVRLAVIASEQHDAYRRLDGVPLGSAWVQRGADGKLKALSASCPHLGCAIDYDDSSKGFRCPCHKSAFDLAGERKFGPAKRGMDPLEVHEEEGRILVRWQRFKPDVPEREPA